MLERPSACGWNWSDGTRTEAPKDKRLLACRLRARRAASLCNERTSVRRLADCLVLPCASSAVGPLQPSRTHSGRTHAPASQRPAATRTRGYHLAWDAAAHHLVSCTCLYRYRLQSAACRTRFVTGSLTLLNTLHLQEPRRHAAKSVASPHALLRAAPGPQLPAIGTAPAAFICQESHKGVRGG